MVYLCGPIDNHRPGFLGFLPEFYLTAGPRPSLLLPTPSFLKMIIIQIKDNESVDRALKRFKKKFERTGVLKELRRRTFFQKPSITSRKLKQKAVYKLATYGQVNND